jgi:hypothetical protein
MNAVSQRDRDIWKAAINFAAALCAEKSGQLSLEGADSDVFCAVEACADELVKHANPCAEELAEIFKTVGVYKERDFLGEALNSGDGVYRP